MVRAKTFSSVAKVWYVGAAAGIVAIDNTLQAELALENARSSPSQQQSQNQTPKDAADRLMTQLVISATSVASVTQIEPMVMQTNDLCPGGAAESSSQRGLSEAGRERRQVPSLLSPNDVRLYALLRYGTRPSTRLVPTHPDVQLHRHSVSFDAAWVFLL